MAAAQYTQRSPNGVMGGLYGFLSTVSPVAPVTPWDVAERSPLFDTTQRAVSFWDTTPRGPAV